MKIQHGMVVKMKNQGFTLLELLAVVAIIAILATISIPLLKKQRALSSLDKNTISLKTALKEAKQQAIITNSVVKLDLTGQSQNSDTVVNWIATGSALIKGEAVYFFNPKGYMQASATDKTPIKKQEFVICDSSKSDSKFMRKLDLSYMAAIVDSGTMRGCDE